MVLTGVIFYISQSNKKLMTHIEELTQRLEEQEDLIKKHEKILDHFFRQTKPSQQPQVREVTANKKQKQPKKKDTPVCKKNNPPVEQPVQVAKSHTSGAFPQRTTVIHMSTPFSVPQNIQRSQKIRFVDQDEAKITEEEDDEKNKDMGGNKNKDRDEDGEDTTDEEEEDEEEEEEKLDSELHSELKDLLGIDSDDSE